jgi:hypothetical protein
VKDSAIAVVSTAERDFLGEISVKQLEKAKTAQKRA